jgi:hypothetical protein
VNIYQIQHVDSGKSYIGKNAHPDVEHRWEDHKWEAFNPRCSVYNTHFHRAIRKYGVDAFRFSSLATAPSLEKLAALETEFILKLGTNNHQLGFNSTTGGEAAFYNEVARKNMSDAQKLVWANSPKRREAMSKRVSGNNFGIDRRGSKNPFFGKEHIKVSLELMSANRKGKGIGPKPLISKGGKRAWERNPKRREEQSLRTRAMWADPIFREKMRILHHSDEFRQKCNRAKI